MPIQSSLFICTFYLTLSFLCCHCAGLVPSEMLSSTWLRAGLAMFGAGITGNFYHHWLLANLRKPGDKGYKIPTGGFFEYVAAPHYFMELIEWLGAAVVSQHLLCLLIFFAMTSYLTER